MAYLTYTEFITLTNSTIDEDTFNRLLIKASDVLDHVTNHFYTRLDIKDDPYAFRGSQFKKALSAQIEFFDEAGATSFEGINKEPQSFSAGRTSVTSSSRYNPSGANESKSVIAEEVYMHLSGTGLLYRGV